MAYNGGPAINVPNMVPSNSPFATKTFTVTGNNVTTSTMRYNLSLKINSNTFSYNALQFKLISTNTGSSGVIVPSITSLTGIKTGARTIFLGNGSFGGTSGQDKVHTYKLELYFPLTGQDQTYDTGKSFSAVIDIKEGIGSSVNDYLDDLIINQFGFNNITVAPSNTFSSISGQTDNKMHKMPDDYGMSYYFRGAKEYVKNNLIFANHQWKIVRINGNGTIRIIYNGKCANNSCTILDGYSAVGMGSTAYNTTDNNNRFVGYMYGNTSGSYAAAHSNQNNSNIKTYLDNWYNTNIKGTAFESRIADTLFCNDRSLHSGNGYGGTGTTYYKAYDRVDNNKSPSLRCTNKNDRFTVSDTVVGNGALTNPIGLLTVDEASVAGLLRGSNNTRNYLNGYLNIWLMSPSRFYFSSATFLVNSTAAINSLSIVSNSRSVRGVINLKGDTRVTGTGSISDPYKVI